MIVVSVVGLAIDSVNVDSDPTDWTPKSSAAGFTSMPPVAVPESATTTEPLAAVAIVSVAACAPAAAGWNVTVALVDASGSRLVVPGAPTLKLAAFGPSIVRLLSVTPVVALRLAIVTVAVAVPPTTTVP